MRRPVRLNAFQSLVLGLALVILTGGALLSLPIASKGAPVPFLNALFTSTSASCVTGLVVYDTYSQFTLFGQIVICLLIQIGGLGFMMIGSMVSFLLGRRIGLHERSILMESVGGRQIGGVVRLTKRTLKVTAIIESCGAVVMSFWFCPRFGFWQGVWMGVFHSVSAFCNAGFDIMGIRAPKTSFITAAGVPVINITIMLLIITGGLGFYLWDDLATNKLHCKKYCLHTKIVLTGTAVALVGGTVLFYLLERDHAFATFPNGQKWLMAAFQSVTPRTAGFNTVDLRKLTEGSTLLTILLMFIGAGSGSTGGGIKVNTFAVMLLGIVAYARQEDGVDIFHRRVNRKTIYNAYSSAGLYLTLCLIGCMVLCFQGFHMEDAVYEVFSAMGTVGVTRGITPLLPVLSKIVIMLLMYAGRVGSLSVALAMTSTRQRPHLHNVTEEILIG